MSKVKLLQEAVPPNFNPCFKACWKIGFNSRSIKRRESCRYTNWLSRKMAPRSNYPTTRPHRLRLRLNFRPQEIEAPVPDVADRADPVDPAREHPSGRGRGLVVVSA